MATFGEFFAKLRRRLESTGTTSGPCADMDNYKGNRCTELVIHLDREDEGWQPISDQELSYANLLEFSREMTAASLKRLTTRAGKRRFDPDHFRWELDSFYQTHHAMLEVARECGLDPCSISGWENARKQRRACAQS